MAKVEHSFMYGDQKVTLESGEIARQAEGAVLVSMGNTRVLVAVTAAKEAKADQGFFPLTVHYQEKFYAAGRIPGGFLKRESRPSELETLTSRLIDRPIRPLFPEGFKNEVQVLATVLALDPNYTGEVAAMLGTSAALTISGVPFKGPIGAAQIGYLNGQYELNPSVEYLDGSELILSVAGTESAVLMVESEADELTEEVMLGAVMYGHQQMQVAIEAIKEFDRMVGKPKWEWSAPEENAPLVDAVNQTVGADLNAAYSISDKSQRVEALAGASKKLQSTLLENEGSEFSESDLKGAFKNLQKDIVRQRILKGEPRIDGRDKTTVRPIAVRTGVLPMVHGSALFTRGETQALVVTTLGTERDAKMIDDVAGFYRDNFMLHYNFPPYSVGETGRIMGPGRREIGHGMLARRGISSVLPRTEDFPYTIRIVSEITESNGSSSMASICGTSLSLMDAGVPIVAPVAGIAMGLIKEGDDFAVLSDILGDEDHLGDMDFKVAGTDKGITTMQMDIKIDGITEEIMRIAVAQAREGRLHILGIMNQELPSSRTELASTAPRYIVFKINPEKIGDVIGKGGSVIKKLQEVHECTVEIGDTGEVKVSAATQENADNCIAEIEQLVADVELNAIYEGTVSRIVDFGAFIKLLPNKDGLLHISQISDKRVENVSDELSEGETVTVKVIGIDRQGKIRLTAKDL